MFNLIYWSPFVGNVGTIKSCINSAIAFKKFSKEKYNVKIINVCGEWDNFKDIIQKNNIQLINLSFNFIKYLPKTGFLRSRISYILIFLISFFPLLKLLKKERSSFFIAHLITSLPLFLNFFFNLKCKMILRISGYPRLHLIRKSFWKLVTKKVHIITCPTDELKTNLINLNIFDNSKIKFLPDAIIDIKDFLLKKIKLLIYQLPKILFYLLADLLNKKIIDI